VEQARADRRHVELQLRDDLRDRERMRDVRIARLARLAVVRLRGELVRPPDHLEICGGMVPSDFGQDLVEVMHYVQCQVTTP